MYHLLTLLLAAAVLLSPAASTDEAIATVVADQAPAVGQVGESGTSAAADRLSAVEMTALADTPLGEPVAVDERSGDVSGSTPDVEASDPQSEPRSKPDAMTNASGGWNIERRITFYGPGGHYGKRTACGQVLTTKLVGVATYLYPCGTKIQFKYRGRTIIAPVVDRGPASWTGFRFDLTGRACVNLVGSKGACWTIYNVAWRVVR